MAGRIAAALPPEVRAVSSYVARSRSVGALSTLLLQVEVESDFEEMTDDIFREIEAELGDRIDDPAGIDRGTGVEFEYETRLLLPAMITDGYVRVRAGETLGRRILPWTRTDEELIERLRDTSEHVVEALLDGDMRDAINDEEFEDFETNLSPRERVAEVARSSLESRVHEWLEDPETPQEVADRYHHAVEISEAHQDDDAEFRSLLRRFEAATGDERPEVASEIRDRYKFADPRTRTGSFERESDLPYFWTQYERVGIIYEDMLGMYEAALGIEFEEGFKRSLVLLVVAAQIGLDDTDDFDDDRGTQLTPVTAEFALGDGPEEAVASVEEIFVAYVDRAAHHSNDHLSGVAIEYVRQQGLERIEALPAE